MCPDPIAAGPAVTGIGGTVASHLFLPGDVDSLTFGTLGPVIVRKLLDAETSHRRLAFRAVLDALRDRPGAAGPLMSADEAWDLLVDVERRRPAAVKVVLDSPFAGAWAARLLRRLHTGGTEDVPLWVEVGYLHTMAASAVVHAGGPLDIRVPMRQGVIHLPTLGHTRFADHEVWETATVRMSERGVEIITAADRILLEGVPAPTPGGPGGPGMVARAVPVTQVWRPTRVASAVGVVLEDADPYRLTRHSAPPVWLPAADLQRWERKLAAVWTVLREGHPGLAEAVSATVAAIVALPAADRFHSFSASSNDAVGSVEMSEPHDPVDGAATLAHELRHALLGALSHLDDLVDPRAAPRLWFVPWRDDPRPTRSVLQGVYAYHGVTDFWRIQRRRARGAEAMLAHFEFAVWRRAVLDISADLLRDGPLTGLGRRFLSGLRLTALGWIGEPVPTEARRLADLVHADTRAMWRIHHLVPEQRLVHRLAAAWSDGAAVPADVVAVPQRLRPDPRARALDSRARLARRWLAERDAFRRDERDAVISAADAALIAGDGVRAGRLYARTLDAADQTGSADRRDLVGLGLALGEHTTAGRVLRRRPDLVHAVARAAPRGGGAALAAWLSPCGDEPSF